MTLTHVAESLTFGGAGCSLGASVGAVATVAGAGCSLGASVGAVATVAEPCEPALGAAADHLGRQDALGDAVQAAALALAQAAGPAVEDIDDIQDEVAAAMATIGARYTMARERTIHALHAPQAADAAQAAAPPVNDDALLEAALF